MFNNSSKDADLEGVGNTTARKDNTVEQRQAALERVKRSARDDDELQMFREMLALKDEWLIEEDQSEMPRNRAVPRGLSL